jgi:hypothetical protein
MLPDLLKKVQAEKLGAATPHCNNLIHQFSSKSAAHGKSADALIALVPIYLELCALLRCFSNSDDFYRDAATELDRYLLAIRSIPNVFLSQSDFVTSVIPEFFLRIFHSPAFASSELVVTGQREVPIEISFDTRLKELLCTRTQRLDIAAGYASSIRVGDQINTPLFIPILAAEAKTYFDKNMISGVEYSAAALKRTFPHCLYLAISEFADFDLSALSYASGKIDEIFILRRQKRSDWRKSGVANPILPSIIQEIIQMAAARFSKSTVQRLSLHDRLENGKLIASH